MDHGCVVCAKMANKSGICSGCGYNYHWSDFSCTRTVCRQLVTAGKSGSFNRPCTWQMMIFMSATSAVLATHLSGIDCIELYGSGSWTLFRKAPEQEKVFAERTSEDIHQFVGFCYKHNRVQYSFIPSWGMIKTAKYCYIYTTLYSFAYTTGGIGLQKKIWLIICSPRILGYIYYIAIL